MSDFTDYLENQIVGWLNGTAFDAAPSDVYVGLHTADPGDDPDGTTEVSAGDYSRATGSFGTSGFDPSTFFNSTDIEFGVASSDWGTITHVSLWTAQSGGDALATTALSSSATINTDDFARFQSDQLVFEVA